MKLGVLFSGGKDSVYATYILKNEGHEISCLISIHSENNESFMFHTPNIGRTKIQSEVMGVPLIIGKTKGEKEIELKDLEKTIIEAVRRYKIEGIITGAIKSVYQASRIQKICDKLNLKCFNPLWEKDEIEYLGELIKNKFKIVLVGVFAYPFDEKWLFRELDSKFIKDILELNKKYKIHPAGEGGEYETFVLDGPVYSRPLKIKSKTILKEGENSFRGNLDIE
ncbi:TIGR00289 family protein [Candidatus Pacearchaeota archaeon CG10_big_fil_rev_8_21_14_0_10_32_42]|nr:MAG: TIGR00289 family protein [Candidatus Pacearchaeota archaeon CG10_big_fil_rev_8_21_14_0_10_32_42]